ncbi:anthranilate phosphoribosyltransferase [Bacillus sonorensis]|uniref:Anthranilate phosphoribosyltransferase n=2 Tax=Bacillus sonorensis TaxID=119858 RepID=M5P917_9BACI|nr:MULTISPECIES: anthranilate phosphoribosyltransferase [Bacillus]TWK82559.1 Anthranilate phosphoribosyltransferase [Bacillus paralicheniformis]ASB88710.1 Anthranilate phosphoribosyltransferase [Bacillus sonorensis]EME76481.1 anthranilate phosphoribosyltransferase [Bacillus sonorensis L12]MBG9915483.1 anthranilate phosphoribosyltransferase [Bacillus sonorensis]MCF7618064.1 anthranilate phosphoribosyltransferase [Bacillus sonorensis]
MNELLKSCVNGRTMNEAEAYEIMHLMMNGSLSDAEIGGLLSILAHRGETVEEVTGFVRAMREKAFAIEGPEHVVDTCGTGGDGISSFNISTAAAIIASAAGAKIAKHGNRSVSSKSGSADVLEYLGVSIQTTPEETKRSIERLNMGFLYAPSYHSSMKHVAGVRKDLAFRTVFNLLGPLSNPMKTKRQVIGVYSIEKAKLMAGALESFEPEHVLFVSSRDGLDELSITSPTDVIELKDGQRFEYTVEPADVGLPPGALRDIQVGTPEESGRLILNILRNNSSDSALHIAALNAGAALYVSGRASGLKEGAAAALETIKSGEALKQLERLKQEEEEIYAESNH